MKTEAIAGLVVVVLGAMATGAYALSRTPGKDDLVVCYDGREGTCFRVNMKPPRCIETACTLGVLVGTGAPAGYYSGAKCECAPGAHLEREGTIVTCRCDAPDAGSK